MQKKKADEFLSHKEISDRLISVTLLDTKTNKKQCSKQWSYYWWSEGNGSCDCNRELSFGRNTENNGYCLGCYRYLIIESSFGNLGDLNFDYPPELKERFLCQNQERAKQEKTS